jgi:hypothetical protein
MNVHFREITRVIQPPPCYSARFKHSTNTNWEDHTKIQPILGADLGGAVPADIEHENRKNEFHILDIGTVIRMNTPQSTCPAFSVHNE